MNRLEQDQVPIIEGLTEPVMDAVYLRYVERYDKFQIERELGIDADEAWQLARKGLVIINEYQQKRLP